MDSTELTTKLAAATNLSEAEAWAIGLIRHGEEGIATVANLMHATPHAEAAKGMAQILIKNGGEQGEEAVLALLENPDAQLRRVAAEAAGKMNNETKIVSALKAVIDTTQEERSVQFACIQSLGTLADKQVASDTAPDYFGELPASLKALTDILQGDNKKLHSAALKELHDYEIFDEVANAIELHKATQKLQKQINEQNLINTLLHSPSDDARQTCAIALLNVKNPAAAVALIDSLQTDKSEDVRRACVDTMRKKLDRLITDQQDLSEGSDMVKCLLHVVKNDPSELVRKDALISLYTLDDDAITQQANIAHASATLKFAVENAETTPPPPSRHNNGKCGFRGV